MEDDVLKLKEVVSVTFDTTPSFVTEQESASDVPNKNKNPRQRF